MSRLRVLLLALLGTTAFASVMPALAGDLGSGVVVQPDATLPAVSGVNGKWQLDTGLATGGGEVRGAGSLSAPLGDRLGVQGDGFGIWGPDGLVFGGAGHLFARVPSAYLGGIAAGVVVSSDARLGAIGGEGELYLDRVSIMGWAGIAGIDFIDPSLVDKTGLFAMGDIALYPTDDLRLTLGASTVLGDLSVRAGAEYELRGLGAPVSLVGDARLHADGRYALTIGLKGYFGGDRDKSLIERQRQDDPDNRGLDLFAAAGDDLYATAPTEGFDNE
jgi:hypothetical protein